jgi:E3 ubiquitin-protein ligase HERC4
VHISLGNQHTLYLTEDGGVLSSGIDDYGRLGTGASSNATTPQPLLELVDETITQVGTNQIPSFLPSFLPSFVSLSIYLCIL